MFDFQNNPCFPYVLQYYIQTLFILRKMYYIIPITCNQNYTFHFWSNIILLGVLDNVMFYDYGISDSKVMKLLFKYDILLIF